MRTKAIIAGSTIVLGALIILVAPHIVRADGTGYVLCIGDTMTGTLTIDVRESLEDGLYIKSATNTPIQVEQTSSENDTMYGIVSSNTASGTGEKYAVSGYADSDYGTKIGIYGFAGGDGTSYGVKGVSGGVNDTGSHYGVYGHATSGGFNVGVYGRADNGTTDYAGYFHGDVYLWEGDIELRTGDYRYENAKYGYHNTSGTSLVTDLDNANDQIYRSYAGYSYVGAGQGVLSLSGYAPVNVPNGVTLNHLKCNFYDTQYGGYVVAYLYRSNKNGYTTLGYVQTSSVESSGHYEKTTSLSSTVDNDLYGYYLRIYFRPNTTGNTLRFYNCRVRYYTYTVRQ